MKTLCDVFMSEHATKSGASYGPCDYETRRAVADHFEFVKCGKPGKVCVDGPEWQRGHCRCKKHIK